MLQYRRTGDNKSKSVLWYKYLQMTQEKEFPESFNQKKVRGSSCILVTKCCKKLGSGSSIGSDIQTT
jgi:hypothetical protein